MTIEEYLLKRVLELEEELKKFTQDYIILKGVFDIEKQTNSEWENLYKEMKKELETYKNNPLLCVVENL